MKKQLLFFYFLFFYHLFKTQCFPLTLESKEELEITKITTEKNKEIPHLCNNARVETRTRFAVKSRIESNREHWSN